MHYRGRITNSLPVSYPNVLAQKVQLFSVYLLYLFRSEGIWYYQLMENERKNSIYGSLRFST